MDVSYEYLQQNLNHLNQQLAGYKVTLVAVSKTHSPEKIRALYDFGQRHFGENKVQELLPKHETLPKDIYWHLIGHLQTNKVKFIAPFVHLIHSVDSEKLLREIDKQAEKNNRGINILIQVFIASEETKFGMDFTETKAFFESGIYAEMKNVRICGLMGMASNVEDEDQIRNEFAHLKKFYDEIKLEYFSNDENFNTLSMGMSSDFEIALEEGSNLIRVGSAIFGERKYGQSHI